MPHIHIHAFDPSIVPMVSGNVRFEQYAHNMEYPDEGLLKVDVSGISFLIQVKRQSASVLLKAEKISRPSPHTLVKKALQAYLQKVDMELIHGNIGGIEKAKLQEPLPCLKEISRFDASQLPHRPIWMEVGFGSGRHLIHQARMHPDVHLIGLEIHRPSLEQVMRRIALEKLENVWVIDYDARLFLELLPSNRIERIFVHFPVPWDKKPHRRVISDAFVMQANRVLCQGGKLELRTDSDNYFHYAVEVFSRPKKARFSVEKNGDAAIKSKYEERWLRLEKDIYELHFESLETSASQEVKRDFLFTGCRPTIEALFAKRPKGAQITEDFFIHIERFYAIDEREGLIRVSLGSFDRPEHKYLLIQKSGVRYYPYEPVATQTNLKAHRMLKEWLCDTR